ncbi:MAG: hypothetical protein HY017_24775 [Betaproteobacteria bacterium]|nr:hypothetical protein [Betaproteobacteria bacterium]
MKARPLAYLLASVSLLPPALGDDSPRRRVIEQKSVLVQRVLGDSPVAQRIAASGSDQAKTYLSNAAEQYRRAQAHAAEGRLEASEAAIDEAMVLISKARQLAPDRIQIESEQRVRYAALLESTHGLLASARRQGARNPDRAAPPEIARGAELIARGQSLAGREQFVEAHRALLAAERELLAGLPRLLESATLDYTVRVDSPEDEFRHESDRFVSFRRLVPIALAELKPAPDAMRLSEQHVQRALELRDAADTHSARGDVRAALGALRESIEWLQRALTAAGLAMQTAR